MINIQVYTSDLLRDYTQLSGKSYILASAIGTQFDGIRFELPTDQWITHDGVILLSADDNSTCNNTECDSLIK